MRVSPTWTPAAFSGMDIYMVPLIKSVYKWSSHFVGQSYQTRRETFFLTQELFFVGEADVDGQ